MHGGSRTPVYGSRRIRYGGIQAVGDSCGVGAYASAEGRSKAEGLDAGRMDELTLDSRLIPCNTDSAWETYPYCRASVIACHRGQARHFWIGEYKTSGFQRLTSRSEMGGFCFVRV